MRIAGCLVAPLAGCGFPDATYELPCAVSAHVRAVFRDPAGAPVPGVTWFITGVGEAGWATSAADGSGELTASSPAPPAVCDEGEAFEWRQLTQLTGAGIARDDVEAALSAAGDADLGTITVRPVPDVEPPMPLGCAFTLAGALRVLTSEAVARDPEVSVELLCPDLPQYPYADAVRLQDENVIMVTAPLVCGQWQATTVCAADGACNTQWQWVEVPANAALVTLYGLADAAGNTATATWACAR